jgi:hypothetical protein
MDAMTTAINPANSVILSMPTRGVFAVGLRKRVTVQSARLDAMRVKMNGASLKDDVRPTALLFALIIFPRAFAESLQLAPAALA